MRLKNKNALITGGHTSYGRAIAQLFMQQGAAVHCVDHFIQTPEDSSAAIKQALAELGSLDILINCTPVYGEWLALENTSDDVYKSSISASEDGVFFMCREAFRYFHSQGKGVCVNVCSISAVGGPEGVAYEMAQYGIIGMTRNIALQYAGNPYIRCNAVCVAPPAPHPPTSDNDYAMFVARRGKRYIKPAEDSDTANAVLFFSSEDSRCITGQYLQIDGGFYFKAL